MFPSSAELAILFGFIPGGMVWMPSRIPMETLATLLEI
jgi:hypothetical protein